MPPHLLPQRADLFRQADATRGGVAARRLPGTRRLSVPRPFGIDRGDEPAGRPGIQHRVPAGMTTSRKIRVLVIDDSASVRQTLTAILHEDPEIEVIAAASDPFAAARYIQDELPDVITLDVEMPRMDGITFLRKIMAQCPVPVVMCSSLTESGVGDAAPGAGGRRRRRHPETARRGGGLSDRGASADPRHREGRGARTRRRPERTARTVDEPQAETDRGRGPATPQRPRDEPHHRDGGMHGGIDRRHRGAARGAGGAARQFAGHRHRPAHAGEASPRRSPSASTDCARSTSRRRRTATP